MRTLGIDPGSRVTGWGLVSGSSNRPSLDACGEIRLEARLGLHARLLALQTELERLLVEHGPEAVAVEWPFHGVNARSALQLAHARGVVLCTVAAAGLEPAEYSPATIKKAVTGSGRADKDQVLGMVARLLRVSPSEIEGNDSADALAAALCHQQSARAEAAVGKGQLAVRSVSGGGKAETWESLIAGRRVRGR